MTSKTTDISSRILKWYDKHGRKDLPWQISKTHYRVWVSEIMLQQTQVQTVIPYFEKFMARFPTLEEFANASLDEALLYWAGLGYYARIRNLHKAANIIQHEFEGKFPESLEKATSLPGLGRSTASAILSIASNQPLAILDGNVKRVLARVFRVDTPIQESKTLKTLWEYSEQTTPSNRNADYTQAIMDLGATLCTRKKPRCNECPIKTDCIALQENDTDRLPVSVRKLKRTSQNTDCLVLIHNEHLLLTRRPNKGIWGGLYTPVLSSESDSLIIGAQLKRKIILPISKHVFTHIDLFYRPIICELKSKFELENYDWHPINKINEIALPKPIMELLKNLSSFRIDD